MINRRNGCGQLKVAKNLLRLLFPSKPIFKVIFLEFFSADISRNYMKIREQW